MFVEKYFSEEFWHWRYQFVFVESDLTLSEYIDRQTKLYNWCLENLNDISGWHVKDEGVIILNEDDATAFKLRWL